MATVVDVVLILHELVDHADVVAVAAVMTEVVEPIHADGGPLTVVVRVNAMGVGAGKDGVTVAAYSQRLDAKHKAPRE